jgi:PAB-dependent poly(A)-specific ribonuclease subunit 3
MNINLDSAKDTLCKNILIYGYCKYENKGCVFSHSTKPGNGVPVKGGPAQQQNQQSQSQPPSQPQSQPSSQPQQTPQQQHQAEIKRKFNLSTPSFQPSVQGVTSKFSNLSPRVKEIPIFVPSTSLNGVSGASSAGDDSSPLIKKFNVSTPSFTPSNPYAELGNGTDLQQAQIPIPHLQNQGGVPPASATSVNSSNPYLPGNSVIQPPGSSDVFFHQHSQPNTYPLQYHLYAPAPPPRLRIPLPPHEINVNTMFIPNDLRESLQKKNEATMQTLGRTNLPDHINIYHSLVPIDKSYEPNSRVWGLPTSFYKVFSNVDGNAYALRKVDHNFAIINELPFKLIKKWKAIKSANLVQLHEAFTTMAFGKSSLVFVYDYYPNSDTLLEFHKKIGTYRSEPLTEELLWTYLVQLVNVLTAIHGAGIAARTSLDLSKIIVTNKNRIRLSSCGISDVLNHEVDDEELQYSTRADYYKRLQKLDMKQLGKIMLELSVMAVSYGRNVSDKPKPEEVIQFLRSANTVGGGFSDDYIQMLTVLNGEDVELEKFHVAFLSKHVLRVMNALEDSNDALESQMTTELENGRLFRLMAKLNFIIDRPELKDWTENGNKYIIKLFRDYIFFQYDEYGKPVIDLAKVLVNLNKVDAGIDEKFLLVSRDEKTCIIVSYKEIRDIVDSIFRNLTRD